MVRVILKDLAHSILSLLFLVQFIVLFGGLFFIFVARFEVVFDIGI